MNPYKLGIEIYRYAESRGQDLFQIRRVHNDVSIVHKLVDEDFALEHILPIVGRRRDESGRRCPRRPGRS